MAIVFITGSTDGLGRAAAQSILDSGHKVVLHARSAPRAATIAGLPLATGVIAVLLDLFLDPIAVLVGYWLWLGESSVYYGIPLLHQ